MRRSRARGRAALARPAGRGRCPPGARSRACRRPGRSWAGRAGAPSRRVRALRRRRHEAPRALEAHRQLAGPLDVRPRRSVSSETSKREALRSVASTHDVAGAIEPDLTVIPGLSAASRRSMVRGAPLISKPAASAGSAVRSSDRQGPCHFPLSRPRSRPSPAVAPDPRAGRRSPNVPAPVTARKGPATVSPPPSIAACAPPARVTVTAASCAPPIVPPPDTVSAVVASRVPAPSESVPPRSVTCAAVTSSGTVTVLPAGITTASAAPGAVFGAGEQLQVAAVAHAPLALAVHVLADAPGTEIRKRAVRKRAQSARRFTPRLATRAGRSSSGTSRRRPSRAPSRRCRARRPRRFRC